MRFVFLLLAFSTAAGFAADTRDVYYQGPLAPLNILPSFEKGYLAVYDLDDQVALYAPDGSLAYRASPHIEGASYVTVYNAGADENGTLAVAVEFRMPKAAERSGGIVIFDQKGAQSVAINTGAFRPTQLSFGPDHSIWTIGYYPAPEPEDYSVLRNYSATTGELIGGYLPRSSFAPDLGPVGPNIGGWQLRVSDRNVVALFYWSSIYKPGQPERRMLQWVETDLKGKELLRRDLPRTRFALSKNGDFYGQFDGVSVFDKTNGRWRKVSQAPGELLGADGNNLVFMMRGSNIARWVPAGQ